MRGHHNFCGTAKVAVCSTKLHGRGCLRAKLTLEESDQKSVKEGRGGQVLTALWFAVQECSWDECLGPYLETNGRVQETWSSTALLGPQ